MWSHKNGLSPAYIMLPMLEEKGIYIAKTDEEQNLSSSISPLLSVKWMFWPSYFKMVHKFLFPDVKVNVLAKPSLISLKNQHVHDM